jgi:class 3 adenylate cyclase
MTFEEIVDQAIEMVRRRGQVSYRLLKRQFALDDASFEDLKDEILYSQSQIVDDAGRGFVWTGDPEPDVSSPTSVVAPISATDHKPSPISYTPPYLTEKILTSRSALEGERKQVTVLFADIKDSTELIRDLDPEDAQKLLDPAIHIMMDAVHRFEGTVNQVLGDGIMSIFGAPIAHEDHAVRACYAALAMQTAMQPYTDEVRRQHGIEMQIRVGLNSGEVVVRSIGNDLHMDYSAVGPTTHLAARMEQLARPGSIRFPASTMRLVEGFIRVQAIGSVPVKGMTEPVEVYELTGASTVKRRLQAAVARGLTKFVGRDMEIETLNHTGERAESGHGQVVAAVGEAGVGKSRLVYEFIHSHRTQGWLVLESASVSYGKATPYFPVVDLLKRYAHVEDGDDVRTIRAKVTGQILTLDESLQETIPPLLSLLDALPEGNPFLQLDPPQRRQRTLDGLKRILLRESQVQPLLLVFEDLHWIDSETQALLDSLVESLPTARLLLLVNYRPEYQHSWGSKTFYTQLRLDPLPPESADAFLQALLGDDPSLEPLKKLLIERTEGNPFFLEESVRTLVETQVLVGEPGAYRLAQESPTIQVPATVQAVLAARIDRLPQDEKRLLQTAAVIGNDVPLSLLQAIAEMPEEAMHRGLTHLQAAEFLYETSLFPERVYTFKHALTHEVAYGSLLQERRRALHARIVEALEALGGDRVAEQVERLANHALR